MLQMKRLVRITIPAAFGVCLLSAGCGGSNSVTVDPEVGEQRKQARINAYGPSGIETKKGAGGAPAESAQSAARRKAQGGR